MITSSCLLFKSCDIVVVSIWASILWLGCVFTFKWLAGVHVPANTGTFKQIYNKYIFHGIAKFLVQLAKVKTCPWIVNRNLREIQGFPQIAGSQKEEATLLARNPRNARNARLSVTVGFPKVTDRSTTWRQGEAEDPCGNFFSVPKWLFESIRYH